MPADPRRIERLHIHESACRRDGVHRRTRGDGRSAPAWSRSFGASPGGRELPLLVLSAAGVNTPAEARRLGRPVVMVVSGIHPGEVEGKEGCLMLARDLLAGKPGLDAAQILENVTLVIVPLFNPDGNDATSTRATARCTCRSSGASCSTAAWARARTPRRST